MTDTRAKLLDATDTVLREKGWAAVSARSVAAQAGVNQALVFYHFGTVADLIDAACRTAVDARVAGYAERFDAVRTIDELLVVARELNTTEGLAGNVASMAQILAAGQHDEAVAGTARYCLGQWSAQVERVLLRVLSAHPLAAVIDITGLANAVTCGFIGVELMQGVASDAGDSALTSLDQLAGLMGVLDDLGPVARRAVTTGLRRREARRRPGRGQTT